MQYFKFEIAKAVLFRLWFCGLWHLIVLSYDTMLRGIILLPSSGTKKCIGDMIRLYGHTAKHIVTHIRGMEKAQETRSEPAAGVSRKYESSRVQTEFSPQLILPWNWKQHIHSNHFCTLGQQYECCTFRYNYTATPLYAYKVRYRTKCTFTYNTVSFPAGHCTVRSSSSCVVPGFTSRRAAQVPAITSLCCK